MNKEERIKILIDASGGQSTALLGFREKLTSLPGMPEECRQELRDAFDETYKEYIKNQVAVYDKYLSEATLDAAIVFHHSEAGKEMCASAPNIISELAKLSEGVMQASLEKLNEITTRTHIDEAPDETFR